MPYRYSEPVKESRHPACRGGSRACALPNSSGNSRSAEAQEPLGQAQWRFFHSLSPFDSRGTRRSLTRLAQFLFPLVLTIITTAGLQTAEPPSRDKPNLTSPIPHDGDSVCVRLPDIELPTAGGQSVTLKALRGEQATVLVFISAECPISNGYVPTLNEIAKDYAARGVAVVAVNPNDGQSLREIAEHVREFQIGYRVLKDAGAKLAGTLNATHCPEAK